MFKGILIEKDENNYSATLKDIDDSLLPEGDVTVRVAFSSLNYKDGLAITGKSPVVRRFPMIPGVDLAGTVEASSNPDYQVGDSVLLNGWGVGETHWGGFAQKARVKGDWLVPLPSAFSFGKPWPLAQPVIPPCCACWRLSGTALLRTKATSWLLARLEAWAA